jgi:hypothetical protein
MPHPARPTKIGILGPNRGAGHDYDWPVHADDGDLIWAVDVSGRFKAGDRVVIEYLVATSTWTIIELAHDAPRSRNRLSAAESARLARAGLPSVVPPQSRPSLSEDERETRLRTYLRDQFGSSGRPPTALEALAAIRSGLISVGLVATVDRVSLFLSRPMYRFLYGELRTMRSQALSGATRGLPEPGTIGERVITFELPMFRVTVSGVAMDSRLSYRDPSGVLVTIILPPIARIK